MAHELLRDWLSHVSGLTLTQCKEVPARMSGRPEGAASLATAEFRVSEARQCRIAQSATFRCVTASSQRSGKPPTGSVGSPSATRRSSSKAGRRGTQRPHFQTINSRYSQLKRILHRDGGVVSGYPEVLHLIENAPPARPREPVWRRSCPSRSYASRTEQLLSLDLPHAV